MPCGGACGFVCKAGDDRNAEVIGMSVLDMHRVAMTRKPVQCHASRAVCAGRQSRVTPKVPVSRTFADAATAELAWWGAPHKH
jgi:hypothetical protein